MNLAAPPERRQGSFGIHVNPGFERVEHPSQRSLFAHSASGKVVPIPVTPPAQARTSARGASHPGLNPPEAPAARARNAAAASGSAVQQGDPLFAAPRQARRSARDESQGAFDFGLPQSHKPFTKVLQPAKGLSPAPVQLRFYSLWVDAIIVAVLTLMFAAAVFVVFRASRESFTLDDLQAVPRYLLVIAPIALSLCYKALWAVFEQPTIGLQCCGLDIVSMDGRRPTMGQRLMRVVAGWLTAGGLVGALWTIVNQERYSMQDLISQTFLVQRSDIEAG